MHSEHPQIESVDHDHCIAIWNGVIIAVWRRDPSAARLRKLGTLPQKLSRLPQLYAVIVVEDKCPVPDDAGRANAISFIRELRDCGGKGICLVFEGAGFLAAASRAVMLGLMTTARVNMPYKVQQTIEQAEEFFRAEDSTGLFTRGRLVKAVEAARAQILEPSATSNPARL